MGITPSFPKIKLLGGEHHRERLASPDEEARYLAAGGELMADIATVLIHTGMRPEENSRLRCESIGWSNGPYGTLPVTHGKTAAARRMLLLSPRVRALPERRWNAAKMPLVRGLGVGDFNTSTASRHVEPSTVKKQHQRALRLSVVNPFVLYARRYKFLTRLGSAGCDAWTLARIAGHSSIGMSARYVRPSQNAVMDIFSRLQMQKEIPGKTQ